jgi:hypothetical protein
MHASRLTSSFRGGACSTLYFVAKCHHPSRIGLDLHKVQSNVLIKPRKEWDPIPDQDWHDRISDFVRQSEAQAFARYCAPSDEPYAAKNRSQPIIHEPHEIS